MRTAEIKRKTAETDIALTLSLDGKGVTDICTGCGFLDHMLTLFAAHGGFDLTLSCKGDTHVDDHHTVEDVGIALGSAVAEALGNKKGVKRYGAEVDRLEDKELGALLGDALAAATARPVDRTGFGSMILPMDEALILAAVDLSGRASLNMALSIPTEKVGSFDTELVEEFFLAFVRNAALSLHFVQFAGKNSHHIIEGAFKAFGRALAAAVAPDRANPDRIPSTKGVL